MNDEGWMIVMKFTEEAETDQIKQKMDGAIRLVSVQFIHTQLKNNEKWRHSDSTS